MGDTLQNDYAFFTASLFFFGIIIHPVKNMGSSEGFRILRFILLNQSGDYAFRTKRDSEQCYFGIF